MEIYPERIEDVNKAHIMALAGDALRTQAATYRKTTYAGGGYRSLAERNDREAAELENWAGTLYDCPPSSDFVTENTQYLRTFENKNFEFGPKGMVFLSERTVYAKSTIYSGIGPNKNRFDAESMLTSKKPARWYLLQELRKFRGEEIEAKLESMLADDSTTLGDLVRVHQEVWQEIYDDRKARIEKLQTIIEEVRTGRATEYKLAA